MTDKIKQGDLLPDWSATLYDGQQVFLATGATNVRVIARDSIGTIVIDRNREEPEDAVTLVDGVVTMEWQAGDTAIARRLEFEIEVMFPGPKPQTFPGESRLVTVIYPDTDQIPAPGGGL